MNQTELEYIINQVTQQVISELRQEPCITPPQQEGLSKVLVVGKDNTPMPKSLTHGAVLFDMEDYRTQQNILRYDRVVITKLNITQLADIAQGRIGDEVSCAVLHALLNGIETLILEDALTFRKYAGKGSTALYHLMESYAQTLQVFGIKPAGRKQATEETLPPPKPPKYKAPALAVPQGTALPNASRLVTEQDALSMVKTGLNIHIPAGTIITPSARDVFSQAGAVLEEDS